MTDTDLRCKKNLQVCFYGNVLACELVNNAGTMGSANKTSV